MGAFLDKPKTDKHNEAGEGNGVRYGLASMQGWRVEMEDAHCAVTGMKGHMKDWSFFAVFDGHAGARASTYCATQLLDAIVDTDDFRKIDADTAPSLEEIKNGLKEGFLELDTRLRATNEVRNGEDKSGSTAVTILMSPTAFFFANCGDSRAMLIRNCRVEFATEDHKPGNPNERERIINAGGSVIIQRVNGSLAVSRALGDFEYKNVVGKGPCEQLVSPEPEITVVPRKPDEDQFIVLACDGVWDVMTNEELCEFLISRMRVCGDLSEVCNQVIDTCLYKGSRDNMSIVVVALKNSVLTDADSIAKEKELDASIERTMREMFEQCEDMSDIDAPRVLHRLNDLYGDRMPPGGGLAAKRVMIDELYGKLHEEYARQLMRRGHGLPNPIQSSARRVVESSVLPEDDFAGGAEHTYNSPFLMDYDSEEHGRHLTDADDDALLLDRESNRERADAFNEADAAKAASNGSKPQDKADPAASCESAASPKKAEAADDNAKADCHEPAAPAETANGSQNPTDVVSDAQ